VRLAFNQGVFKAGIGSETQCNKGTLLSPSNKTLESAILWLYQTEDCAIRASHGPLEIKNILFAYVQQASILHNSGKMYGTILSKFPYG